MGVSIPSSILVILKAVAVALNNKYSVTEIEFNLRELIRGRDAYYIHSDISKPHQLNGHSSAFLGLVLFIREVLFMSSCRPRSISD